jgi:isopenicillin N synthase-like dioxygenase
LRALAIIEGNMDPEYFTEPMKEANPQLRLLHYMGIQRKALDAEGHWRINPHCDYGLCTILFQGQVGELEVDPDHTGKFLPATPVRGTCVINVSFHQNNQYSLSNTNFQVVDLLQRLSNNRLKSTRHRVTLPQITGEQKGTLGPEGFLPERYSTAFFVHPAPSTTVAPILLPGEPASEYEPVNAGEWREGVTRRNYTAAHLHNKPIEDKGKPFNSQIKAF